MKKVILKIVFLGMLLSMMWNIKAYAVRATTGVIISGDETAYEGMNYNRYKIKIWTREKSDGSAFTSSDYKSTARFTMKAYAPPVDPPWGINNISVGEIELYNLDLSVSDYVYVSFCITRPIEWRGSGSKNDSGFYGAGSYIRSSNGTQIAIIEKKSCELVAEDNYNQVIQYNIGIQLLHEGDLLNLPVARYLDNGQFTISMKIRGVKSLGNKILREAIDNQGIRETFSNVENETVAKTRIRNFMKRSFRRESK